jgi:hypothetical protein
MNNNEIAEEIGQPQVQGDVRACHSIEWYSEGQVRTAKVGGVQFTVRFVARRGRRARIAISGPPGTVFRAADGSFK